jgi:DNA-binding XRE family transcriptional regulator
MKRSEFKSIRKKLNKTQKHMAQLLGISIKAIHSYEQGWRSIPVSVERQLFFLLSRIQTQTVKKKNCWTIKKCPTDRKKKCPAWEFSSGKLCWFINGTICEGASQMNWQEKMKICRKCEVFEHLI